MRHHERVEALQFQREDVLSGLACDLFDGSLHHAVCAAAVSETEGRCNLIIRCAGLAKFERLADLLAVLRLRGVALC